jgi:hypothetical protein
MKMRAAAFNALDPEVNPFGRRLLDVVHLSDNPILLSTLHDLLPCRRVSERRQFNAALRQLEDLGVMRLCRGCGAVLAHRCSQPNFCELHQHLKTELPLETSHGLGCPAVKLAPAPTRYWTRKARA